MIGQTPAPSAEEKQIEEWIRSLIAMNERSIGPGDAWVLEWTEERRTTLSAAEVERLWKSVEPFPDHPDRMNAEQHRKWLEKPEIIKWEVMWRSDGPWRIEREYPDGSSLVAADGGDTRWMLYTSAKLNALTLTARGVPFPADVDIGTFRNELSGKARFWFTFGLSGGDSTRAIQVRRHADGR